MSSILGQIFIVFVLCCFVFFIAMVVTGIIQLPFMIGRSEETDKTFSKKLTTRAFNISAMVAYIFFSTMLGLIFNAGNERSISYSFVGLFIIFSLLFSYTHYYITKFAKDRYLWGLILGAPLGLIVYIVACFIPDIVKNMFILREVFFCIVIVNNWIQSILILKIIEVIFSISFLLVFIRPFQVFSYFSLFSAKSNYSQND